MCEGVPRPETDVTLSEIYTYQGSLQPHSNEVVVVVIVVVCFVVVVVWSSQHQWLVFSNLDQKDWTCGDFCCFVFLTVYSLRPLHRPVVITDYSVAIRCIVMYGLPSNTDDKLSPCVAVFTLQRWRL